VPLYVDPRGLTTRRLLGGDVTFSIDFDFIDHRLVVRNDRGALESFALFDGLSVSDFYHQISDALHRGGIDVAINARPFGLPITTPFIRDHEHSSYQREYVESFWRALAWVDSVFGDFSSWFGGKSSPVHLFWHSFDLAVTRFSGRRAFPPADADPVTREAYSAELISFGFWPGDPTTEDAAFYSYTHPEPDGLRDHPLHPESAYWRERTNDSLAILPYDAVRRSSHPRPCSWVSSKAPIALEQVPRDGMRPSLPPLSVRAHAGSKSYISEDDSHARGCLEASDRASLGLEPNPPTGPIPAA